MRALRKAPYAGVFRAAGLSEHLRSTGFEVCATEYHGSGGNDARPYIVARKR